jgi:hypothetical protein
MLSEPIRVTQVVIQALDQLEIPYFIGGSLATAVYGFARATMDVDIVADVQIHHVRPLVDLLQEAFYIDTAMVEDAVKNGASFNLIHLETMFKVDIFLPKDRAFDRKQMEQRVSQTMGEDDNARAFFASPEDIILAKLEWYRDGGEISDRQWRDILGVLSLQKNQIDLDYLRKWATTLHLTDLLTRVLKEVDLGE